MLPSQKTSQDIQNWLLSDEVCVWTLDNLSPTNQERAVEALYELALKFSDPGDSVCVELSSKNLVLGIDRRRWQVFLSIGSRRAYSYCPHSLSNHVNKIEFEPRSLLAALPKLLQGQGLQHPRDIWRQRAERFCKVNPKPEDFFPNHFN